MNDVSCCGRLFGVASSSRSAGKFWYSFGWTIWNTASGVARPFSRTLPRSFSDTPAGRHSRKQIGDRLRHEHLAAVRGAHDPRRAIDRAAEIIVVARLHGAGVHAAADRERHAGRRRGIEQRELDVDHRAEAIGRSRERRVDAVARRLDDPAPIRAGPRRATARRGARPPAPSARAVPPTSTCCLRCR